MTATDHIARAQRTAPSGAHLATVLVGLMNGGVALLRADTGATIWREWVGGEITGLAHGGDTVYLAVSSGRQPDIRLLREPAPLPPTPITYDASGAPIYERDPTGRRDYHIRQERVDIGFDLARIEARQAANGALLWSFTSATLPDQASIALNGETLAVWSPLNILSNEDALFGLDARTGAPRWQKVYTPHDEPAQRSMGEIDAHRALRGMISARLRNVLLTRNGRFYVEVMSSSLSAGTPDFLSVSHQIEALDAASGALLWSHAIDAQAQSVLLSWGGALVIDMGVASANGRVLTARDASSGALVGALTYKGDLCGVTDDGVVYVLEGGDTGDRPRALRIDGASTGSADQEVMSSQSGVIFVPRASQRDRDGHDARLEVQALDLVTGETRWTWRSPENLAALLRLWGLRAPGAFAASILRQLRKEGFAFLQQARREFAVGQWRHPATIAHMRIDEAGDTVYLGGRLGVFALRASDGSLRWAGLPNVEVNTRLPLLIFPSSES